MNLRETRALVMHVARLYPGKVTVDDAIVELWANSLANMTPEEANDALVEFTSTAPPNHTVCRPADLWAAHRRLTIAAVPDAPRPELQTPTLDVADELPPDEYVRAALAEARAIIGPTQYTRPENRMPRGAGSYTKRLDPKTAHERQIAWDELQRGHS